MGLVIKGGYVYTVTNGVIENGVIVIGNDGRIKAIGKEGNVKIPPRSDIINASGKHIIPGLIDPHTHMGISEEAVGWESRDTNEITEPITSHLRAIDGVKSDDTAFQDAIESGVTVVGVLPGSGNPLGGLGAALKCYGSNKLEMLLKDPIGLKMAFGENPKRVHGLENKRAPATRMAIAGLIRECL